MAGKRILLAALALLCFAMFAGLGVWQVERRAWKLALIEAAETRAHAPPMPALPPTGARFDGEAQVYRHVTVTGRLLPERSVFVTALTDLGSGFWLVTPLEERRDFVVLVNRGFVPTRGEAPARDANPSRDVTLTGLVRISEPGGGFLRPNRSAQDLWYSRDVAAIAKAKGLRNAAPYFIDADAGTNAGTWPRGGLTVLSFPNNNAVYALTWFVLAGMSLVFALRLMRRPESPGLGRKGP